MAKAVVVGLGRSGVGAANLLAARGYDVVVTDSRDGADLSAYAGRLDAGVRTALGGHPQEIFDGAELVVVSPGVPLSIEPLRRAREGGARVIGELELACRHLPDVPMFAVTGTNGKSTTVTLLHLMLDASGGGCVLAGNIGYALAEAALRDRGSMKRLALEVSSFQLEAIERFKPRGAAILNVTPDHLDRYASMDDYRAAKGRIALNQDSGDFLVLNADDPECMKLYDELRPVLSPNGPAVYFFSRRGVVNGVYARNGGVFVNMEESYDLIGEREITIRGVHNLENAMAAALMALRAGCARDDVRGVLRAFPGLEHRLEPVRELGGVRYVNDSKGTNIGAVEKSLESFGEPVVLIAGGRGKGTDFGPLADAAKGRVRAAVLIGESAPKLRHALEGSVPCVEADDMRDAVRKASGIALAGDVVLLSPACASFDMFRDYEDRGRRFKEEVMAL